MNYDVYISSLTDLLIVNGFTNYYDTLKVQYVLKTLVSQKIIFKILRHSLIKESYVHHTFKFELYIDNIVHVVCKSIDAYSLCSIL